ncbi:formate dehydrogenase cytochrome b556 subunit [Rahnella sp. FC061912-K]|uniref:formate dehydrogenase cytochrome b556 subunit n=1 Tax=Rahnella rivi TaxID=2816249 RepID=UPI001C27E659|nr:formate dehydrogenase cytochrome b556 subunit [Rahnella rivi]MBU9831393.1 formate dehydrogenase cytochrome b556 subunit [Rahnella rivi]
MKKEKLIQRYNLVERLNHWIVAFCFVTLALSGIGFFFPSFNWLMNVYGTPQLARILHPFFGVVMFVSFLGMFFRYWKHNLPEKDDLVWAKNIDKVLTNHEVGDTGRYNFGQKCVFWAAIGCLVLLMASGVIIWRPWFADYFPIPLIRLALLVHSVAGIGLILVIIMHVYAATWAKGSISAMTGGKVPVSWAKYHHPRWYRQVRDEEQKKEKDERKAG